AGEAHMVTPLTDDSVSIRAMVPSLSPNIMPVMGNNPSEAVVMARSLLDEAMATNGRILLLSSGFTPDQSVAIQNALAGSSYPLHIIGVSSNRGAAIPAANGEYLRDNNGQVVTVTMDADNLSNVAGRLNGRYRSITIDDDDIEYVLASSLLGDSYAYMEAEEQVELWYDAGPWFLLLLLPLCALCFRRGWILQIAVAAGSLLLVMPSGPVIAQQAGTPFVLDDETLQEIGIGPVTSVVAEGKDRGFRFSDLWRNRDQRGLQALEEENDPMSAAILFEDSAWRGTANYRAGNYEA